MGLIYTAEFDNAILGAVTHRIEIHKLTGGTDLGDMCLTGSESVDIYTSHSDDMFATLVATNLRFDMEVKTGASGDTMEQFVQDLVDADPGEYYVKYYRKEQLHYIFTILNENMSILDDHRPYPVSIQCTDAVGLFSRYNMDISLALAETSLPLITFIYLALIRTGIMDYYGPTDRFVATSLEFRETNYGSTDDPLVNTRVSGRAFIDESGEKIVASEDQDDDFWRQILQSDTCDAAVTKMLEIFVSRMYQVPGAYYRIAQLQESETIGMNQIVYSKSAAALIVPDVIVSETYSDNYNIDCDTYYHRIIRAGNQIYFLPKVRDVVIRHELGESVNIAQGLKFKNLTFFDTTTDVKEDLEEDVAYVDNTGQATLELEILFEHYGFSYLPLVNGLPLFNIIVHLTIRIGDKWLYRKRTYLNDALEWEYTEAEWVDTVAICEIVLTKQTGSGLFFAEPYGRKITRFELETPEIPESGDMDVQIQYIAPIRPVITPVRHIYQTVGALTQIDLPSHVPLPDPGVVDEEDIKRIVKVKVKGDAYEYKASPTSGQPEFGIDYGNNRITFGGTITGLYIRAEVDVEVHGDEATFLQDTAKFAFGYETAKLHIQVNSETPSRNANAKDFKAYIAQKNQTNRERITREVFFGDLPESDSVRRLQYYIAAGEGYDTIDTRLWLNRNTGTSKPILQLAAESMADMRHFQIRKYVGRIGHFGTVDVLRLDSRIAYETYTYLPLSYKYNPYTEMYDAVMIEINRSTTGTTSKTSGIINVAVPVFTLGKGKDKGDEDEVNISTEGLITHTSGENETGIVTTIDVNAVGNVDVRAGDTLVIVNPVTGERQEVTVTQDIQEGDTVIHVSEYFNDVFPDGSLVISPGALRPDAAVALRLTGLTGTTIDLTGYVLPDETLYTEDQMNDRLTLHRNGTRQSYRTALAQYYDYNSTSATATITLQMALTADEEIVVKWG